MLSPAGAPASRRWGVARGHCRLHTSPAARRQLQTRLPAARADGTDHEASCRHCGLRPEPCRPAQATAKLDAIRPAEAGARGDDHAVRIRAGRRRGQDLGRADLPDTLLARGHRQRIHRDVHAARAISRRPCRCGWWPDEPQIRSGEPRPAPGAKPGVRRIAAGRTAASARKKPAPAAKKPKPAARPAPTAMAPAPAPAPASPWPPPRPPTR